MDAIIAMLEAVERARGSFMRACGVCPTCVRILSELDDRARVLTREMYAPQCNAVVIVVE